VHQAMNHSKAWKDVAFTPIKAVHWGLIHIAFIASFWWMPTLSWQGPVVLAVMIYLTMCLGVALGQHRGLIHESYQSNRYFQYFLVFLSTLAGLGGPLSMSRMHSYRDHFQKQPECPAFFGYGYGIVHSYVMWMFMCYTGLELPDKHTDKLAEDRFYVFLNKTAYLYEFVLIGVLFSLGGWEWVWWGSLLRLILCINFFWFVSYVSHTSGYVTFPMEGHAESGRNNLLFGYLSFGEAWHNNHHAYPSAATTSLRWWELDVAYLSLKIFEKMGWVSELKMPEHHREELILEEG